MAITVGVHASAQGANGATTPARSTTTGSTLVVAIIYDGTFSSLTASPAITFTQRGTTYTDATTGQSVRIYSADNITASASQTVTLALTGSASGSVFVVELLGARTAGAFDVIAGQTDTASPFTTGGITTTQASAALVAIFSSDRTATLSATESTGFTQQETQPGSASQWGGVLSTRIVSATGTYDPSYTESGTTRAVVAVAAFKDGFPTITSQPLPQVAKVGDTATFTVSATASAGSLSYQWQRNTGASWADIGSATSSSYTTPTLTVGEDSYQYRVNVTDSNGTTTSDAAILDVWQYVFDSAVFDSAVFDTDPVGGGTTYTRTSDDSLSPADQRLSAAYRLREQLDSFASIDGSLVVRFFNRSQSDGFGLSDNALDSLLRLAALSDSINSTDALTSYLLRNSSLSDSVSSSDAVSGQALRSRTASDAAQIADAALSSAALLRLASDSSVISDAALRSTYRVSLSGDSLTASDVASQQALRSRLAADSVSVLDASIRQLLLARTALDSLAAFDDFVKQVSGGAVIPVLLSDSLGLQDFADRDVQRLRALADSIAATDSSLVALGLSRLAQDAASALDAAIASVEGSGALYTYTATDQLGTLDSSSRSLRLSRTSSDQFDLLDSSNSELRLLRILADGLATADPVIRSAFRTRTLSDSSSINDSRLSGLEKLRSATDSVALSDAQLFAMQRVRALFDSVDLVDNSIVARISRRALADAIGINEELLPEYTPFVQYQFTVNARIGASTAVAVVGADDPIRLWQSSGTVLGFDEHALVGSVEAVILGSGNTIN